MTAVFAFALLSLFLIAGKVLRLSVPAFRRYFVPSSILGGATWVAFGFEYVFLGAAALALASSALAAFVRVPLLPE